MLPVLHTQRTGRQDARPESAPTAQCRLRARAERVIHPVAGATFLGADKPHALNFKFLADELIQIHPTRNGVAAEDGGRFVPDVQLLAEGLIDLVGKESNLPVVADILAEEPVAFKSEARHTTRLAHFTDWAGTRRLAVMAKIIVSWRDVEVQQLEWLYHEENMRLPLRQGFDRNQGSAESSLNPAA